ncbi:MAG: NAD-dependent epimerase/dehydratase family protein, partial [Planctomycetota bacterium]
MPGKLLLTGAAGFLGTNILLELLKTEVEIFALIHNTPLKVNNPQIRILQSSLDSIEKLKNDIPKDIDAVIHCAGLTKSVVIENFYKVNFTGTKNLIEFFIKNKINIRHFIFISSISAVGPQKEKVA